MRAAQNIERFIKRFYAVHKASVRTDREIDGRIVDDALQAYEKLQETPGANFLYGVRRAVMISNVAKLAVAAAITVVLLLGASLILNRGVTPAYAIEQTIEAIKNVRVVHILGRDWHDKRIEMWIKVNPDTGLMHSCHISYLDDERLVVSMPKNTYDYDKRINTVRIKDGPSIASIFCLGDFFQGMERLAETLDGKITYCEVTEPGTEQSILELKMSAPETEILCLIDPKNKLPISINVTRGGPFGSCDILKHATKIRYSDVLPQGLFDFTIPAEASVSAETSEDPLQNLPVSVIRYCGQFHVKTVQERGNPQNIPVNTRMYFVDSDFNLRDGGFMGIHNDSNQVWKGEISVFNVDPPNMALFDAASGKKQQIRLVQHRQLSPGTFRVYWNLEEPLRPGQTRYGIWWASNEKKLGSRSTGSVHCLVMNNCFGGAGIENFILIVPVAMDIHDCSRQYESHTEIDKYKVCIWQRHLPEQMIVNQVDVALSYSSANYTVEYIQENTGKVLVEIPETFELANVAIAVSERGLNDPYKVNKSSAYYQRLLKHFLPFKDHPLIVRPELHLNFGYQFRDNSLCYVFDGDRIVHGGLYTNIREPHYFKQHLALVQDFATVSNFRKFYRDNLSYYQQQIRLYRQKVPVRKMWTWLEERFPARHDCYKIVFSPLVGASHETCGFEKSGFRETIMFISGPGERGEYGGALGEARLSRVVFTEIDHNYVNRVTGQYAGQVNRAFADLRKWSEQDNYPSPEMMFNEYMTWAVFVLYAYDTYDSETLTAVKKSVIKQMVQGRKFIRFGQFTEELLRIYQNRRHGQSIPDLYPAILAWAEEEASKDYRAAGWLDDEAWMIIGPFDNTDMTGFDSEYPPEKEMDFTSEYAGKEGNVKWFRPKRGRIDGFVDLAALLGRVNWAVAYAATSVQSPQTREVQLRIGSDDDVKVWLNGELVLSRNVDRPAVPDQDMAAVTLRKGQNQLLLKICNRLYSWGFYARITDANEPRHGAVLPAPRIAREQAIEDLDFLVEQLKVKHPKPFAKVSEQDFSNEIERLKAALSEEVLVKDFSLSIAALLALVGDDHTRHRDFSAFHEHVRGGGLVFPVKFRYQGDRMRVEAWSPDVSPAHMKVGDMVMAVNGDAMESLLQRYGRYISVETDLQRCWALEWSFDRYQVMLGDIGSEYTLQLRDSAGETYSETLPAVKPWREQYENAEPKAPRFHHQFYEDGRVCLFKLQTFDWSLRGELESKLMALVDAMKQNKTEIAILDLRGNGGGNSNMGSMVFVTMIGKPYGELRPHPSHSWPVKMALLCDRGTYSAASFEAMLFKDYGMGTVAGEETGGRASGCGDIEHVTLPNSLLSCGIATGYFPRRAGYDDGRGVLPDLPLDVTLEDHVLVERISAHIGKSGAVVR